MLYSGIIRDRREEGRVLVFGVEVCVPTSAWATDDGQTEYWTVRIGRPGLIGQIASEEGEDCGTGQLINLIGEELNAGSRVQVRLFPEHCSNIVNLPKGFIGC